MHEASTKPRVHHTGSQVAKLRLVHLLALVVCKGAQKDAKAARHLALHWLLGEKLGDRPLIAVQVDLQRRLWCVACMIV